MPTYSVKLPITGYAIVEVKAADEEAAILAALISDDLNMNSIEVWNGVEHVVQGNVFYGELNHAEAELLDDED